MQITYNGMRNQNAQAKVFKTQKQIAEACEIAESRYSLLMKGKANPTIMELAKMSVAFDCEIQDLVEIEV